MVWVGPRVRHLSRLVRPNAKDRIARLALLVSGASVDPDAVRLAAGLPPRCPEAVRDSRRSALAAAPEPRAVPSCWALRPLGVLPMAAYLALNVDAFPLPVAAPEFLFASKLELLVAQPEPLDESESPQEARSEQASP
jgi:hypothetical protein